MINHRYHKFVAITALIILTALFCYFRLNPIFSQTVPYTYDQGRDFLKAEEIVRFKNPTLIGPTTGIQGLHHGVWWYYFLSAAYAAFGGLPQGFYLAIFLLTLVSSTLFFVFLKKEVHPIIAVLFALIVTVSPYFIGISFFAGNNILTTAFVLLFIYASYMFMKSKDRKYLFLTALAIGFIFETEVVFGLLLIPAFIVSSLFINEYRKAYLNIKNILFLIAGGIIPFIPRILFELKNSFLQTRAVLYFLYNPSQHNPQGFKGAFDDRVKLFASYITEIFYENSVLLTILFIACCIAVFFAAYKKSSSLSVVCSFY